MNKTDDYYLFNALEIREIQVELMKLQGKINNMILKKNWAFDDDEKADYQILMDVDFMQSDAVSELFKLKT